MLITRGVREFDDLFDRAQAYTTTPGVNGWTSKKTGAGTPTHLNTANGAVITLSSTSEAQVAKLYQNDVLTWPLAGLQHIEMIARVADISAVTDLVFGIASDEEDALGSLDVKAYFRIKGSASTSAVIIETDDDTVASGEVATGQSLAGTFKRFEINFTYGLQDVRFLINGQQVATATKFDMSRADAGQRVQPYIQLQKASGATTPSATIRRFKATYDWAYGA